MASGDGEGGLKAMQGGGLLDKHKQGTAWA